MSSLHASLENYLKDLRLPTMRRCFQELAQKAEADSIPYEHYLLNLAEREYENRRNNTIQRHLKESQLPLEKSLSTLDLKLLPVKIRQQFNALLDGSFLKRRENVLIFGGPGRGKTHILCALAQELVHQSYRVYFTPCTLLVQRLLIAKQALKLTKLLKHLSAFDALIIDDIGYVQQSQEEMEVLFTLLAQRYERSSVLISSNLPFSDWNKIFKDPMTTAAAIDRLVHHCVILELSDVKSYRANEAQKRIKAQS